MEHNATATTELVRNRLGQVFSRTVASCRCGWSYAGEESPDRMADAHNASFPTVDNDCWKV